LLTHKMHPACIFKSSLGRPLGPAESFAVQVNSGSR